MRCRSSLNQSKSPVLRGTALVIGIPRKIVLRRVARDVLVEVLAESVPPKQPPSWAVP